MPDWTAQPEVGLVVAGKYRLTRLLGRGGMGSVWEGVHESLGTRVAVKFIEAEFSKQPELRDRFVNEARAAARLQSKHIVQIYDHGVGTDGRPYIVMEYLSGEPLDVRLAREGALPVQDVAPIIVQLARGLRRAHEAGIVHRDLKPENVFLVWDEEDQRDIAKIVDFGIAKFSHDSGITSSTRTGAVMGTPHFMSPEQARGLKAVDQRSDIWSVGVIAYRAVTGVLPFDGEAMGDLLVKICTQSVPPPSDSVPVPPGFDAWVEQSLAKDPSQRFATAEEQSSALAELAGLEPTVTVDRLHVSGLSSSTGFDTAAGLTSPLSRSRSGPLYGVAAVLVVGLAAGAAWVLSGAGGENEPSTEAQAPLVEVLQAPAADPSQPAPTVAPVEALNGPTEPAPEEPAPAPSAERPTKSVTLVNRPLPRKSEVLPPGKKRPPGKPPARPTTEDELGY